jgi:3-methyladenine DNA glycosylase AlkC
MAEQLKTMFFTEESLQKFADVFKSVFPEFDSKKFLDLIHNEDWEKMELTEKMRHTTCCLNQILPEAFPKALDILKKAAPHVQGFESLTLPDYVALFGMEDWDLSLPALGYFTRFSTSELAVRPFLDRAPDKVMPYMLQWAEDKDEKVRRFSSEGCRPRLPWAMALPKFKKDPSPILPVLEKLKNDPSEFVRRSVANNLNDISKSHPDLVLDICESWYGKTDETDKIVKHACRTLLKAGDKRALRLFGYSDPGLISVQDFTLEKKQLPIGGDQFFSFTLKIKEKKDCRVRLEYAVEFQKSKGKTSRKVFKISESCFSGGYYPYKRKHRFADMSTRKHHPGRHKITLIVNGESKAEGCFDLNS